MSPSYAEIVGFKSFQRLHFSNLINTNMSNEMRKLMECIELNENDLTDTDFIALNIRAGKPVFKINHVKKQQFLWSDYNLEVFNEVDMYSSYSKALDVINNIKDAYPGKTWHEEDVTDNENAYLVYRIRGREDFEGDEENLVTVETVILGIYKDWMDGKGDTY